MEDLNVSDEEQDEVKIEEVDEEKVPF